ncbi:radical SAM family heme chaperone HemW [Candidatus Bandiella numerosa]|uniref:radical SAM family heme chaperone HemW n=1 Tax=Candidatus Bandiella numerosa TaxID=2570586 RepID=UPI001F003BA9|nr:radical SAM family heme chaperone HemW [Candidatus Bandiella numerosa]
MNSQSNELSIYIHWPFCKTKCPYCDFNSHENDYIEHDSWKKSYLNEIELNKDLIKNKKIRSIFFGGGTPSLMKPNTVDSIINKISSITDFSNNIEITLEANPNSVDRERFRDFKSCGINRVSIGIQSIRDNNLKFLGRSHSQYDALKAIEFAREIFDNYSFDLMYCLPGQQINEWESELNEVLKYVDYHISCYQLTIEKSTKFFNALRAEEFQMPNEEISIAMYKATYDILKLREIKQYEISNYSRAGYECKHNLSYWELGSYIGLGPGAHGRYIFDNKIYYTINYYNPQKWLKYVDTYKFPIQDKKEISNKQNMMDVLTMGLRLNKGIHASAITNLKSMNDLITKGFLVKGKNNYIKSTIKGRLVLNTIIQMLI